MQRVVGAHDSTHAPILASPLQLKHSTAPASQVVQDATQWLPQASGVAEQAEAVQADAQVLPHWIDEPLHELQL